MLFSFFSFFFNRELCPEDDNGDDVYIPRGGGHEMYVYVYAYQIDFDQMNMLGKGVRVTGNGYWVYIGSVYCARTL